MSSAASELLHDLDFANTYCVLCRRDAVNPKTQRLIQNHFAITCCCHVLCQACLQDKTACPKCSTSPLQMIVLDYQMPSSLVPYFKSVEDSLVDLQAALRYQINNLTEQVRFLKKTALKQKDMLNQANLKIDQFEGERHELEMLRSDNEQLKNELNARIKSRRIDEMQVNVPNVNGKRKLHSSSASISPVRSGIRLSLAPDQQRPSPIKEHVKQYQYRPLSTAPIQPRDSPSLSSREMPPPTQFTHRSLRFPAPVSTSLRAPGRSNSLQTHFQSNVQNVTNDLPSSARSNSFSRPVVPQAVTTSVSNFAGSIPPRSTSTPRPGMTTQAANTSHPFPFKLPDSQRTPFATKFIPPGQL